MYEIVYDGEVFSVETTDEVNYYYEKAQKEQVCIEVYELDTRELVIFWCPDPDN